MQCFSIVAFQYSPIFAVIIDKAEYRYYNIDERMFNELMFNYA